jgi:hypothetical protein
MKIYLASRFSLQNELKAIRTRLEATGNMEVTSRWLDAVRPPADTDWAEFFEKWCQIDMDDIWTADYVFIVATEVGKRAMMHGELGAAIAWNKKIIVVGNRWNALYYHPTVFFFETMEEGLKFLGVEQDG